MKAEVKELLGAGLGSAVSTIFGKMEVVEEEIELAQKRHPDHDEELWSMFKWLRPGDSMFEAPERLYRCHCKELLQRKVDGKPLNSPTSAEVLNVLRIMSLNAPLKREWVLLYSRLMLQELDYDTGMEETEWDRPEVDRVDKSIRSKLVKDVQWRKE